MTAAQHHARNEAFQLISIAARILKDAGLVAYSDDAAMLVGGMRQDAQMLAAQEIARRMPA